MPDPVYAGDTCVMVTIVSPCVSCRLSAMRSILTAIPDALCREDGVYHKEYVQQYRKKDEEVCAPRFLTPCSNCLRALFIILFVLLTLECVWVCVQDARKARRARRDAAVVRPEAAGRALDLAEPGEEESEDDLSDEEDETGGVTSVRSCAGSCLDNGERVCVCGCVRSCL